MGFGGNSGGGSSSIATSTDVALSSPTNTQVLTYDGTTAKWKNANNSGGGTITADDIVETSSNKVMTAAERTKLSGIATGATANSSDATLLNRANHTGTQLASTISDFSTAADARVLAKMAALGAPITVVEVSGAYPNRPAYTGPVRWKGVDQPATGGTTSGGTAAAVNGLDEWYRLSS